MVRQRYYSVAVYTYDLTYEELKHVDGDFSPTDTVSSYDLTYEELKLRHVEHQCAGAEPYDLTYEELKLGAVPRNLHRCATTYDLTYEELKRFHSLSEIVDDVLTILPMRN